jgi:type I restriction enzyme S subunit
MAFYNGEKVILGKSAAYLNFNSNINKFYYYYFQLNSVQLHFYNVATGSTIKNLSLKSIQDFEVPFPTSNEWKKIVAVLSALDSKIELNNKINTELESMAKTLYDYWFVQFDFPDKDGNPYKTSGGKMVWNDELKREIPGGWEVGTVLNVAELLGGGTPKKEESSYWNGTIPFFTPTDTENSFFVISTKETITEIGLKNCSSKLYPKGTIFITARGTVGNLNIASKSMAMNQSCYAIQAKENINFYFLHQCVSDFVKYLKAKANGSVFDAIVSNDFKQTPIVIPSMEVIKKFGSISESIYEKILINRLENQTLSELRDWLLPMLMNGQVRVDI